ncbi:MAG: hypothetical protein II743_01080 [Lachnospiraceae bacterium]|nr:hypothetical protein [Lachnospiraceae bacterium]
MNSVIIMSVVLLVVGAICFIVSFIIPSKEEPKGIDEEEAKQQIHDLIEKQVNDLHDPMKELANNYVNFAYDGALNKLDDAANEKMFEITTFSDTVMREIKKEEEDVMQLHQAVKDEHENLQKTAEAASKAARAMRESIERIQGMRPVEVSYGNGSVKIAPMASKLSEKK